MTAPFTFPTSDFERTAAQDRRWTLAQSLKSLDEELAAARKSEKRSPRKWTPEVQRLEAARGPLAEKVAAAEAECEAEYKARREAHNQVLRDAAVWALSQIGPVEEINHTIALRVRDADGGHDILVYSTGRNLNFEIAYVETGSDKIVERLGYIYGPEEKWSRVSEPGTITKTKVSTSSSSNLSSDDLLAFATALRAVALVASKIDEAFGL